MNHLDLLLFRENNKYFTKRCFHSQFLSNNEQFLNLAEVPLGR